MRNSLEGVNSRIEETEDGMRVVKYTLVEITHGEQNKGKRMKRNEDSLRELWENVKGTNIHLIGVPKGEEKGPEKIFEQMLIENFPNMGKELLT